MYTEELNTYCAKNSLEVVRMYTTTGDEKGSHTRALVKDRETGEQYYLYYDTSRRRQSINQAIRDQHVWASGDIPPLPKQRGWRNTTLDNRKRAERIKRRRTQDEQIRQEQQREAEPGCNGLCRPEHALYEAKCPIHGLAVILEGLSNEVP